MQTGGKKLLDLFDLHDVRLDACLTLQVSMMKLLSPGPFDVFAGAGIHAHHVPLIYE